MTEDAMELNERIENLNRHIERGTLLRSEWGDGKARACLLAALAPEVIGPDGGEAARCPASVMPGWLARLTPSMDDCGTLEAWPTMVRRYAAVAARWHVLDDRAWERARFATLHVIVTEARRHARGPDAIAAVDGVLALLDRARNGEPVREGEWVSARRTAWAAAAYSAAYAASADAASASADASAAAAAASAAWDRMTDGILRVLEDACTRAESAA